VAAFVIFFYPLYVSRQKPLSPIGQHLGELKLLFLSAHTTGIHTG